MKKRQARAFSTPTSVSPWAAAFWAAADCSTAREVAMRTLRAVALSCLACGSRASQSHFSVATYEALADALLLDGATVDVTSDLVFSEEIVIPAGVAVEVESSTGATLSRNTDGAHFRIDGELTLRNLALTNGSVTYGWCSYQDKGGESCGGGSLHVDFGATLTLDNCVLFNNSARYGGAIYSYGGHLHITDSRFVDNYAYEAGGAIFTYEHSTLELKGSTFTTNVAIKAGAVFSGGHADVSGTDFEANRATASIPSDDDHAGGFWGGGGGAFWVHKGLAAFSGSTFKDNYARTEGGAIYINPSTGGITVASTTFEGNDAVGDDVHGDVIHYNDLGNPPTIDCADECPEGEGAGCVPVSCLSDEGATCTCYSCDCTYPAFPSPMPTGPSAAPTAAPVAPTAYPTGWNEFWVDDVSATSATTPSGIALAVATVAALGRA